MFMSSLCLGLFLGMARQRPCSWVDLPDCTFLQIQKRDWLFFFDEQVLFMEDFGKVLGVKDFFESGKGQLR